MLPRRLRPITAPRVTVTDNDDVLARWLAETDRARAAPNGQGIWQIYSSPTYAELWYAAREAGERVRAKALATLYANWREPGGLHPDPREPAAFSEHAILKAAATGMGLEIWQRPVTAPLDSSASSDRCDRSDRSNASEPLVSLITYPEPMNPAERRRPPTLALHQAAAVVPAAQLYFEMACMLAYVSKEHSRLLDPDAPPGVSMLPNNQGAIALMHQFAIALLCLDPWCPEDWTCHCNLIRQRFNRPPAEHQQPTDTLNLADLARQTPRIKEH